MQTKYNITWVAAIILNYDRQGAIFLKKDNKKLKWLGKKKKRKRKISQTVQFFTNCFFLPFYYCVPVSFYFDNFIYIYCLYILIFQIFFLPCLFYIYIIYKYIYIYIIYKYIYIIYIYIYIYIAYNFSNIFSCFSFLFFATKIRNLIKLFTNHSQTYTQIQKISICPFVLFLVMSTYNF